MVSPDYIAPTGNFPPLAPTTVTKAIPSYLYKQYDDDPDLPAFFSWFNGAAEAYVDWFANVGLPIYTKLAGQLLDWIGAGFYGYPRPSLPSGFNTRIGPLNTWTPNVLPPNGEKIIIGEHTYVTTDDVYKRCLTWHLYKGDGKVFTIRWLKRRILRFLIGTNGAAPSVADTRQISVTIVGSQVNIGILSGRRRVVGGAVPNMFALNKVRPNQLKTISVALGPAFPLSPTFKAAVDSGVLELPFQFTYAVAIEL